MSFDADEEVIVGKKYEFHELPSRTQIAFLKDANQFLQKRVDALQPKMDWLTEIFNLADGPDEEEIDQFFTDLAALVKDAVWPISHYSLVKKT